MSKPADIPPPPGVFTVPVVLCPACGHGIDPHGLDPGRPCGVGEYSEDIGNWRCPCMWSPNDIAFTVARTMVSDQVKQIIAAIEAPKVHDQLHARGYRTGYAEGRRDAAGIARSFLPKESNDG